MRTTRRYGWRPALPDMRERTYSAYYPVKEETSLPPTVDLRIMDAPIYDQGQLGACVSSAISGMCEYLTKKLKRKWVYTPSRLFIYYNARAMEGTINYDSGTSIADGMKVVYTQGAPNEKLWPFIPDKFATQPPHDVYENGSRHLVKEYLSVNNLNINEVKTILANGYPVVIGFTVYNSFESDTVEKTGRVPMPVWNDKVIGGHAVSLMGYDDMSKVFIFRNSWGTSWGLNGYGLIPYDYVTNGKLAGDAWTAREIEGI